MNEFFVSEGYEKTNTKQQTIENSLTFNENSIVKSKCTCSKTRCIKKYCECFSNGKFCLDCECENCFNIPENIKSLNEIKTKENAKSEKNKEDLQKNNIIICNCTKSGCSKKYCECFKAGKKCSEECRCIHCDNLDLYKVPILYGKKKKFYPSENNKILNSHKADPEFSNENSDFSSQELTNIQNTNAFENDTLSLYNVSLYIQGELILISERNEKPLKQDDQRKITYSKYGQEENQISITKENISKSKPKKNKKKKNCRNIIHNNMKTLNKRTKEIKKITINQENPINSNFKNYSKKEKNKLNTNSIKYVQVSNQANLKNNLEYLTKEECDKSKNRRSTRIKMTKNGLNNDKQLLNSEEKNLIIESLANSVPTDPNSNYKKNEYKIKNDFKSKNSRKKIVNNPTIMEEFKNDSLIIYSNLNQYKCDVDESLENVNTTFFDKTLKINTHSNNNEFKKHQTKLENEIGNNKFHSNSKKTYSRLNSLINDSKLNDSHKKKSMLKLTETPKLCEKKRYRNTTSKKRILNEDMYIKSNSTMNQTPIVNNENYFKKSFLDADDKIVKNLQSKYY